MKRWKRSRRMLAPLALAAAAFPTASPGEEPAPLTQEQRREVITGLNELLDDIYVIPETADAMIARLRGDLDAGRFVADTDPVEFAAKLTGILQEMSGDQHLRVSYGAGGGAEPLRVRVSGDPGGAAPGATDGPVRVVRRAPGDGVVPRRLEGIEPFPRAELLPGNVACVEVRLFAPREGAEDRAAEVMKTIADADAVVFDLRACMGGAPDMVHLVTSYLYGPEPMHLLTYYHAYEEPDSAYTLAEVPGVRRPDIPVYVVTSRFTGSGGEEFTYNLKHHGRATVVGERTAGAGHGGGVHPVAAGFEAFVPDFRPVHPVTGGGWEGVGVEPDIEVGADRALDFAHREALREIARGRPDDPAALAEEIARLDERIDGEPPTMDAVTLADYAGVYEIRTIRVKDGGLTLQRTGGPELELVPAGEPDHFTLTLIPTARIRFERDAAGTVTAVHVLNMRGEWEMSRKTSQAAP